MPKLAMLTLLLSIVGGDALAQFDTQNPSSARDYYQRGQEHENANRLDEAIADFHKAGELDPSFYDPFFSLSSVLSERQDYAGAIEALTKGLNARPNDYSAQFNRGLYHEYLGQYDEAIADYTKALSEDADFSYVGYSVAEARAHAYHYRGRAYQRFEEEHVKAIADFTLALDLDPGIEMVLYRRGQSYHRMRQYSKAHADFAAAYKQDPDYPNLLNSWAWQLATCPDEDYRDGELAVQLATKTKDMDTLAAALAETGAYADAAATQRLAIEHLDQQPQPRTAKGVERRKELRAKMEARLATYEGKRPFRD